MIDTTPTPSRRAIIMQAWPIMVGGASVPLVGLVDAAIIGQTGDAAALAGVALGSAIISMIFWAFGFLRMGTTGMTAQAAGRKQQDEVALLLVRALIAGGTIGLILMLLQWPLGHLAFSLLSGSPQLSDQADAFVSARFLGAPAALAVYALNGWLLGLGKSGRALWLQIAMNIINIALDSLFVWGFDMGAAGVGYGTAGAEWSALVIGLALCLPLLSSDQRATLVKQKWQAWVEPAAMRRLFGLNANLMVRTMALLFLFMWLANAGARLGPEILAANHLLLQFVNIAAYVLDPFAFTIEEKVGHAIGGGRHDHFRTSLRYAIEFSILSAFALSLLFWIFGPLLLQMLTTNKAIIATAEEYLPFAALMPFIAAPSWILDGIFIGATQGKALRNAALLAVAAYLLTDYGLRPWGNMGVWIAFMMSYVYRAIPLAVTFPSLNRAIAASQDLQAR